MQQPPGFYPFKLGDLEVVAVHDGVICRDRPAGFIRNAADPDVAEAFAVAGMPADKLTLTFTALAIRSASGVVLIDTGFGAGGPPGTGRLTSNLAAAGIQPEDVTSVIISHFHGDHISGLQRPDGSPAFPKADVFVPAPEWAYWMDSSQDPSAGNFALCHKIFDPIAAKVRRFEWGEEVLPGLTAVQADGHTPGMSAIRIASGNDTMMYVADITNNPLVFARHPEWQAMFDINPERTIASRRKLLDQAAEDRMRLAFFHAPFPAIGYVAKNGAGYEYLPALWQAA